MSRFSGASASRVAPRQRHRQKRPPSPDMPRGVSLLSSKLRDPTCCHRKRGLDEQRNMEGFPVSWHDACGACHHLPHAAIPIAEATTLDDRLYGASVDRYIAHTAITSARPTPRTCAGPLVSAGRPAGWGNAMDLLVRACPSAAVRLVRHPKDRPQQGQGYTAVWRPMGTGPVHHAAVPARTQRAPTGRCPWTVYPVAKSAKTGCALLRLRRLRAIGESMKRNQPRGQS
jgi:hypothetical protein